MAPPFPPQAGAFLTCIAGPDQGKRVLLTAAPMLVGRGPDCNLHSDDPWVTERYAVLQFSGAQLKVQSLSPSWPFVDGHPVAEPVIGNGQQIRMGGSVWQLQLPGGAPSAMGFVQRLGDRLTAAAGVEKASEFNPQEMFGDIARTHADYEIEAFMTVGTVATTPSLAAIDSRWPRPWVFARIFGMTILLYAGFIAAWLAFNNPNLIPGMMVIGTVAIPFAILMFFFEMNVPRNISIYQMIKLVLLGGLVSLIVSLVGFKVTGLSAWLGAMSAGIIEETGKGLTLLLVVRKPRFRWTLNGLLLGAAVGTGFTIFESSGYAYRILSETNSASAMRDNILLRGLLDTLGGHGLWTGLVGAALWRVRGDRPFEMSMLLEMKFLRVVFICMAMHMIWNSPIPSFFYLKYVALGIVTWILLMSFIQDGLKQVREAQRAEAQANR